jgi:hypothetical protein
MFVDPQRRRLTVSCGGVIDVLAQTSDGCEQVARIPTVAGARITVDCSQALSWRAAAAAEPATIWVFRLQL